MHFFQMTHTIHLWFSFFVISTHLSKKTTELIHSKRDEISSDLMGSWTVHVGDMDQCLHLWRYTGGFEKIDAAHRVLENDKVTVVIFIRNSLFTQNWTDSLRFVFLLQDFQSLEKERGVLLRSRHLQYMLQFSYWPQITLRDPSHIYEMRSYRLKPGTMIEWGNNWARGINFRKTNNVAFAGFFSQIGRLYNVHHIWCK